ncbi:hypothetical protein DBT52_00930 [Aerococcus mictus]|nr:hypothetical protein DBT52_00930 [Aerococcus mictus]
MVELFNKAIQTEHQRHVDVVRPKNENDTFTYQHGGGIGDWVLKQVQVEKASRFTDYEENTNTESMLGAAFRHIDNLQQFVTDENGDITRMTKDTLRSTLTEYFDNQQGTSTSMLESDLGLYLSISNAMVGTFLEQAQTSYAFSRRINDIVDGNTIVNQTANSWAVNHLNSTGDLISQINLDDSNLRLQGEHIVLDGDVSVHGDFTLDGSAHIRNGTIGTAQIANAAITDAKVSSLSVNSITGLTSQFVKSLWNGINSYTTVDSQGMVINQLGGKYMRLGSDGMEFYDGVRHIGNIGAAQDADDPSLKGISFQIQPNRYMSWSKKYNSSDKHYTRIMTVGDNRERTGRSVAIDSWLDMRNNINMHTYDIENSGGIKFRTSGTEVYEPTNGTNQKQWLNVCGRWGVNIVAQDTVGYKFYPGVAEFYNNLDMCGYDVVGESDIRLKKNVRETHRKGIEWTKQQHVIDFEWDKENKHNEGKPDGQQFGIIAQYAGEATTFSGGGNHYLAIKQSDVTYLNLLTNQELIERVENLEQEMEELRNEIKQRGTY